MSKQNNRPRRGAVRRAIDCLEARQLFAAMPELIAIVDTQTSGTRSASLGAIAFYDVTDVKTAGNDPFGTTPLFSIWPGYEVTSAGPSGRDFEEQSAFAVSPNGRTGYMLAFDSGTTNTPSISGDTGFDYDLYKFDIAGAYNDFITNNRPRGIEYAPRYSPDYDPTNAATTGLDYVNTYSSANGYPNGPTGLPGVTSTNIGIPALRVDPTVLIRDNTDAIGSNDIIFMDGVVAKVGEVARPPSPTGTNTTSFFNQQDIQVVDDNTIVLMQQAQVDSATTGTLQQDFSIRTLERVSASPGLAHQTAAEAANYAGGFNAQTKESWISVQWSGDNYVNLDNIPAGGTGQITDVDGMRYVNRDGVQGVWVSDRDGGGDELAFFKMDFATHTATKQQVLEIGHSLAPTIRLDEDPSTSTTTDDGDLDGFDLDANQNLVIRESNFVGAGSVEGKPITIAITNYNGGDSDGNGIGEVIVGQEKTLAQYATSPDDDPGTLNTQYGTFDATQNLLYFFDTDSAATDGAANANPDAYVYDPTTQAFANATLNMAAHFFQDGNLIRAFTLRPLDNTPPTIASSTFNFAGTAQSISVAFSEDVSASLAAGDFTLTNTTTGTVIPSSDLVVAYNATTNVATITFTGITGSAATNGSVLTSGRYTLGVSGTGVTDAAGNPLGTTTPFAFAFADGDFDHSLTTDFTDLLALAKNYGKTTGMTFASGDANYDGAVNFTDLLILAKNYNKSVPAPAPAAALVVTTRKTPVRATSSVLS